MENKEPASTAPHDSGEWLHALATRLFPICRSITGAGFRESLDIIGEQINDLSVKSVPSGTEVFDWTVPDEWNIRDAYIETPSGERICQLKDHNLHVMGYSLPIDQELSLEALNEHLYSMEDQPEAIPYITSYYTKRWGFCLKHEQREQLQLGTYRVHIDSTLEPGELNYGEVIIPGETDEEVFISTYLCHPSMGNNELSGPVVAVGLIRWLQSLPKRRYTYRIAIVPETIGSIVYLSRNLNHLQKHVVAGFNLTCVGDNNRYSYMPSRAENTLSDRVLQHALKHTDPDYHRYSYLTRGSDERQYCSPGVDLPVASFLRSKYGTFPEYHTSLDDMSFISAEGLESSVQLMQRVCLILENNLFWQTTVPCEPQLGKRGLYPTISMKNNYDPIRKMMNFIGYADGKRDLIDIAEKIGHPADELIELAGQMQENGLFAGHSNPQ